MVITPAPVEALRTWHAQCGVCFTEAVPIESADNPYPHGVFCPECRANKLKAPGVMNFTASPATDDIGRLVESMCKAYAEATDYYVPFHSGLRSESADKMRVGMRAAIEAALLYQQSEINRLREVVEKEREECAMAVPTNWCDPLLTGPHASKLPLSCQSVEALLRGIRDRIRSRAALPKAGT